MSKETISETAPEHEGPFGRDTHSVPWKRRLKRVALRLLNLYPPYVGAGISVRHISEDFSTFEVELRPHAWNRNYFGTHFGGSLYSMCDPFFVLILAENLGAGYVVWDKAATIRFKKPGEGVLRARFHIDPLDIDAIRAQADTERKVEPLFTTHVLNAAGEVVAEVEKTLYVRRKNVVHEA